MTYKASLIVAPSKAAVSEALNSVIVDCSREAIKKRGVFTVALSGGSNVGFLSSLKDAFSAKGIDPTFEAWHVILADERCVPLTDEDSNMGALQTKVFSKIAIPESQIHGINQDELGNSNAVAADYEPIVREVLNKSGGLLDLAVLGFGPDGHTCSLFPNHVLLKEDSKWVASLDDSPKPPPSRITLTYPVLNTKTRKVIFCGAGSSKTPILQEVYDTVTKNDSDYSVMMKDPPPFPCAAVRPFDGKVCWVVDSDAINGILNKT
jgi:6-phosphogluconolactonase